MEELLGCGAAAGCARGIVKRAFSQKTAVDRHNVKDPEDEVRRLEEAREAYLHLSLIHI